jgi:hypothetical protein
MKKMIVFLPFVLFGASPFETPEPNFFDTSAYETKGSKETKMASKNKKINCRFVCDKKLYKEQQIGAAVTFYKNVKESR